jgi:hypothetical protein
LKKKEDWSGKRKRRDTKEDETDGWRLSTDR